GRQLTDDDVTLIADELAFSPDPDSAAEIRKAIKAITRMNVGEPDVERVRARLAADRLPRAANHGPPTTGRPPRAAHHGLSVSRRPRRSAPHRARCASTGRDARSGGGRRPRRRAAPAG